MEEDLNKDVPESSKLTINLREDDYKDSVMQDLYNDISSSESDEDNDVLKQAEIAKKNVSILQKEVTPPKQISEEDRKALDELYKDDNSSDVSYTNQSPIQTSQPTVTSSTSAKLNEVGNQISQKFNTWFTQAKSMQPVVNTGIFTNLKQKLNEVKLEDIDRQIQETIERQFGENVQSDTQKQQLSTFLGTGEQKKTIPLKFVVDEEEKIEEEKPQERVIEAVPEKIDIVKRQEVNLNDFVLQKVSKAVKRPTVYQSLTGGLEERMITVLSGKFIVIKAYTQAKKLSLFSKNLPSEYPQGIVKSITDLSRLFKIDIQVAAQGGQPNELELVLHFINVERDPRKASIIKRFNIKNDVGSKEFLRKFEQMVNISSPFYQK